MNRLSLSRCALSVCVAAILLAGCGGSQGLIGQLAAAKQDRYGQAPSELSGSEVLTASHVRLHTIMCSGPYGEVRFRTEGMANGPLSGSFTAHGVWTFHFLTSWSFHESFTITSGSSHISGQIVPIHFKEPSMYCGHGAYFGPSTRGFHYKTHSGYKGRVKIEIIKRNDFNETLLDFSK